MTTQTITVTRLADLRFGDRIKNWDGRPYNPPRRVVSELGTIAPGSPVQGVRLQNPNPTSPIELVLYPSQMDGRRLEVERETFDPAE